MGHLILQAEGCALHAEVLLRDRASGAFYRALLEDVDLLACTGYVRGIYSVPPFAAHVAHETCKEGEEDTGEEGGDDGHDKRCLDVHVKIKAEPLLAYVAGSGVHRDDLRRVDLAGSDGNGKHSLFALARTLAFASVSYTHLTLPTKRIV